MDNIDIQQGIKYSANSVMMYKKLTQKFLDKKETTLADLEKYMAEKNLNMLTIAFHTLKSTSATFGSTALPPLALELETAGKAENFALIEEKYPAFVAQFLDTCAALAVAITRV